MEGTTGYVGLFGAVGSQYGEIKTISVIESCGVAHVTRAVCDHEWNGY